MNKLPVYLYSNVFEVILDLDDNRGIREIMYQRKLKIQRGYKDSIQIQFKNSDQKPLSITTGTTYWFDMIDTDGRQLVLSKPLAVVDDTITYNVSQNQTEVAKTLSFANTTGITAGQSVTGFGVIANTIVTAVTTNSVTLNYTPLYPITTESELTFNTFKKRGIAEVVFDPLDTINLTAANYKFLIKQDNDDGTYTPIYADTYYGITGEIELVEDGFPLGYPIQTITSKQLETGKAYDRNPVEQGFVFTTGWLRPMIRPTTTSTMSMARLTLAGFKGTITVEGTLDNNPSSAGQANAQAYTIFTYTTTTNTTRILDELDGFTWNTPITAVRFKIKPAVDSFGVNYYPTGNPIGSNNNKFPNGFVDTIQYIS